MKICSSMKNQPRNTFRILRTLKGDYFDFFYIFDRFFGWRLVPKDFFFWLIPRNPKPNSIQIALEVFGLPEKQGGSRPILTHFS